MPPRISPLTVQSTLTSIPCPTCRLQSPSTSRLFSTTPTKASLERDKMYRWLNGPGRNFKDPLPGSTNYIGAYDATGNLIRLQGKGDNPHDLAARGELPREEQADLRPFKLNRNFRSQPVLSEEFREEIWSRVMKQEMSVAQVSRDLGVEMNRVGAVVRLKEMEKRWEKQGKELAKPYAKAIMSMLPQTPYRPEPKEDEHQKPKAHESINDLPVHSATGPQLFYPTSESRRFTRADAASVFDRTLLPADKRIPHPEMIEMKRDELEGKDEQERIQLMNEREERDKQEREMRRLRREEEKERNLTRIKSPRWEFRFREVNVDEAGKDGRGFKATGFRYGAPHLDRKRAIGKIPKRVYS